MKLSVVLATRNEEENLPRCLASIEKLTNEIIVFDEYSSDKTVEIAKKYKAEVFSEPHHDNFHITKQKALEKAGGEWILQLDADEIVSPELFKQIKAVVNNQSPEVNLKPLFIRHQQNIEKRDGKIGEETGQIVGYFIPRRNIFLGKPLIRAGVYPDGVIRLIKNGYAKFPCKSVHEQIKLDGKVAWLSGDLLHYDSPNLKRYLVRLNRYTDLKAKEMKNENVSKNPLNIVYYSLFKPLSVFLNLYIGHKGILDGVVGFLWSFFSALHFPIAYFKYLTNNTNQ